MEVKERELLLEQYLQEAVQKFQQDGGILPGEACASEVIIGATENPIVAAVIFNNSCSFPCDPLNRAVIDEINTVTDYLEAAIVQTVGPRQSIENAFSKMEVSWLHGTYKKTGGSEYTIIGSTSYTSIKVKNNKTGKIRNVPREEAGKAIAENGLTTKSGEFICPTTSKAVMQSIKETAYGDTYLRILARWEMRGKGDKNNIGRTFNDGNACVGVFLGARMSHSYRTSDGVLYIKSFSDDKVVSRKIAGYDDPAAYVVDDAGVQYPLFG